jgi:hypothetical protein
MFIDEGISGAVESRPALNRLMQMVEQDKIQTILTFSFSRIARSTSHLLKTLQKCKDHGSSLTSITEQIDTNSPMGMALFTLTGESIPENFFRGQGKRLFTVSLSIDPMRTGPTEFIAAGGSNNSA